MQLEKIMSITYLTRAKMYMVESLKAILQTKQNGLPY